MRSSCRLRSSNSGLTSNLYKAIKITKRNPLKMTSQYKSTFWPEQAFVKARFQENARESAFHTSFLSFLMTKLHLFNSNHPTIHNELLLAQKPVYSIGKVISHPASNPSNEFELLMIDLRKSDD